MCLEYIAHDLSVERIIRSEKPKPKAEKEEEDTSIPFNGTETSNQAKGKEVAAATPYSLGTLSPFPSLSTIVGGKGDDSSDEDEEDDEADGLVAGGGLRCKMQEAGKFYDTFGIKMWSKEVLGGRL